MSEPLTIQLVYEGGGKFRTASKLDLLLAGDHFGQGEVVEMRPSKRRSLRQHNWFFHLVGAAFDNQRAGPVFDTPERLRKWLLIKVGHCTEKRFAPRAMTAEVAAWLREMHDDMDFSTDRVWIYARTAKSIAFKACDSAEMTAIADRVVDVIVDQIVPGTTRADWEPYLSEAKETARRSRVRVARAEQREAAP